MKTEATSKYSVVDLFAGAGGLSYGFLQTGRFVVKAAFENNRNAQKTYRRNHSDAIVYDDVADALTTETIEKLGHVDVVIGGPPCQGFSNANRQKNHAISLNNSLVKKFVQAVLHLDPIAFVMENVSMLQSEVHRFYVDASDADTIKKYNIKTQPSEICLLDAEFVFDDLDKIVATSAMVSRYLWEESKYLTLNIIFKTRNNPKKLCVALDKYKKKLLALSNDLIAHTTGSDHILQHEQTAGSAIQKYFDVSPNETEAEKLCDAIMPTIMFQRMFSKAKEILDNHVVVDEYKTEHGLVAHVKSMAVIDYIESILGASSSAYSLTNGILSAADFGAPQKRMRFVLIGVKKSVCKEIKLPVRSFAEENYRTVKDAIKDLEDIQTMTEITDGNKGIRLPEMKDVISELGKQLRDSETLYNHVSTATKPDALERFKAIQQGNNFHSLPPELKATYSNSERTQNTIYLRLRYDEPSGTVVNVRKSMWIHPVKHRAISIREAARLQTFPDSFVFCGTKDAQYQQVGNAVPPMLARAIAEHLYGYLTASHSYS